MPGPRVFLVDDHALVRAGVRALLEEGSAVVVGEAPSAEIAMAQLSDSEVDLVIADVSMDGANGLELVKGISARWPQLPVLVLSMHDETLYAERAVAAGARGYLMKDSAPSLLLAAVETICSGRIYLSPTMTALALERMQSGASGSPMATLTDRELEVFERMGQGLTTRQIADALHLSIKTVESHRANLKRKLGATNAVELVRLAVLHVSGV